MKHEAQCKPPYQRDTNTACQCAKAQLPENKKNSAAPPDDAPQPFEPRLAAAMGTSCHGVSTVESDEKKTTCDQVALILYASNSCAQPKNSTAQLQDEDNSDVDAYEVEYCTILCTNQPIAVATYHLHRADAMRLQDLRTAKQFNNAVGNVISR